LKQKLSEGDRVERSRAPIRTRAPGERRPPQSPFGYQLNALLRVPAVRDTQDQEPRLVGRFTLTPAHLDIVDAS
jgi:hypothetical protein